MILRTLCHIAGVDRETLLTCPMTDRLWVVHLGFSLFLSFAVVFAITFHATGYVIADVWLRSIVALVVALTVFLFDRALYQSDWFSQGAFGGQVVDSDAASPDDQGDHLDGAMAQWRPSNFLKACALETHTGAGLYQRI
jgi:hypothetical protein